MRCGVEHFADASRVDRPAAHTPCGAGDGNRTRIASLEGWNSAIELHPR
jgi:hypothetical protein